MNPREIKDLLEQLDDIRGSLRNLERIEDLIEVLEEINISLEKIANPPEVETRTVIPVKPSESTGNLI